jgi:hypothetical protein
MARKLTSARWATVPAIEDRGAAWRGSVHAISEAKSEKGRPCAQLDEGLSRRQLFGV